VATNPIELRKRFNPFTGANGKTRICLECLLNSVWNLCELEIRGNDICRFYLILCMYRRSCAGFAYGQAAAVPQTFLLPSGSGGFADHAFSEM
jgi:hypothetical protein